MAAEKLTKARLVQILIIFSILLTAFSWRSYHPSKSEKSEVTCQFNQPCHFAPSTTMAILFNKSDTDNVIISVTSDTIEQQTTGLVHHLNANIGDIKIDKVGIDTWLFEYQSLPERSRWALTTTDGQVYWFYLSSNQ